MLIQNSVNTPKREDRNGESLVFVFVTVSVAMKLQRLILILSEFMSFVKPAWHYGDGIASRTDCMLAHHGHTLSPQPSNLTYSLSQLHKNLNCLQTFPCRAHYSVPGSVGIKSRSASVQASIHFARHVKRDDSNKQMTLGKRRSVADQ